MQSASTSRSGQARERRELLPLLFLLVIRSRRKVIRLRSSIETKVRREAAAFPGCSTSTRDKSTPSEATQCRLLPPIRFIPDRRANRRTNLPASAVPASAQPTTERALSASCLHAARFVDTGVLQPTPCGETFFGYGISVVRPHSLGHRFGAFHAPCGSSLFCFGSAALRVAVSLQILFAKKREKISPDPP
jgi:hypothetical protein